MFSRKKKQQPIPDTSRACLQENTAIKLTKASQGARKQNRPPVFISTPPIRTSSLCPAFCSGINLRLGHAEPRHDNRCNEPQHYESLQFPARVARLRMPVVRTSGSACVLQRKARQRPRAKEIAKRNGTDQKANKTHCPAVPTALGSSCLVE